ncbi:MAG TPA: glycosyltransferase [Kangiella sp.]
MSSNEKNVSIKEKEYERLVLDNQELTEQVRILRNSTSFKLGSAIISSLKSWRGAIKLPVRIYRIVVEGRQRRIRLKTKYKSNTSSALQKSTLRSKYLIEKKKISLLQDNFKSNTNGRRIKVAAVMDEFTESSFFPECELLQLNPKSCIEQLNEFKPDFLFIESAWQGKNQLWKTIISNCKQPIINCVDWCYENDVQTILWNKEDPVHFSTFIELARHVDYVFTTDLDCIPKYIKVLGHNRVYLLPFAAQPLHHNPIEKYSRKDAFNFAGSYYLRYPQRQADFEELITAADKFRSVDIYDRNYDKDHPHYKFPEEYKKLIIGSLPFSEIDKAYKGYRYGINMNTIKQSQSMFARRVFELLASNTVVISNYSRGVRTFFGDLVISSDHNENIIDGLNKLCCDEITYKKFRLLGLRKVFLEHTYSHRLAFIESKLSGSDITIKEPYVNVFCKADNEFELDIIIENFSRQEYKYKKLHVLYLNQNKFNELHESISIYTNEASITDAYKKLDINDLITVMSKENYYGKNYLVDMVLATKYSGDAVITKHCFYKAESKSVVLNNSGCEYKYVDSFTADVSIFSKQHIQKNIMGILNSPAECLIGDKVLSIDCFNFCAKSFNVDKSLFINEVSDLDVGNFGAKLEDISSIFSGNHFSDYIPKSSVENIKEFTASELYAYFPKERAYIRTKLLTGKFVIQSNLESGKHCYLYLDKLFTREELNLKYNSKFFYDAYGRAESLKSVFEFYDEHSIKISHQMSEINSNGHNLAIPNQCKYIKVGFRIQGAGKLTIRGLSLGDKVDIPATIYGVSKTLVLTKQYPSYSDIYKYGFLHSRVKAYKDFGHNVDVFKLSNDDLIPFREFEGVDIAQGNSELLERTLSTGQYTTILVHMLDQKMWNILQNHIETINVIVWAHGAEIQLWQRREFEFESLSSQEIARQKKLSDKRKLFWNSIFNKKPANLRIVYVSEYFKNEVFTDFGDQLPDNQISIIHNFINENDFPYTAKSSEKRKKILSIRPYASRKYANDLTVKAILELSKKDFFTELQFCLVGDGKLFDELTAPIAHFANVELRKEFLMHSQIADLHKEYGIFLTPTRMDSQGVSRDEAMSSGLVPITNNVAAIPEFVDESCGFLVEPESYHGLADAIETLYKDEQLFLKMSKNASKRVRQQSNFDLTIKKEIELFSKENKTSE